MKILLRNFICILGLIVLTPLMIFTSILILFEDGFPIIFKQTRVGINKENFMIFKLRTMKKDVPSIGSHEVEKKFYLLSGKVIRKFKIDELSQLFNVFIGNMSIVGPRPQIIDHVLNKYSDEEKKLLTVRPGITDFSSIVFSDEGEILKFSKDPDTDYNLLIRPWKSRLGLLYIKTRTNKIDLFLILLTIIAIFSKKKALYFLNKLLKKINAPENLVSVSKRENRLKPSTPPGVDNLK